jgi:hypothetical protein
METPELYINSNVPVYITSANTVTPLMTFEGLYFDNIYTNIVIFFNVAVHIVRIGIQTGTFIMKEIFEEIFTKMTLVKMIYIIGIYHIFILAVLDSHQRKITKQKQQIESLEKQVKHLKKSEKLREDFEELWSRETTKKMTTMEKKIKKMEKDFK